MMLVGALVLGVLVAAGEWRRTAPHRPLRLLAAIALGAGLALLIPRDAPPSPAPSVSGHAASAAVSAPRRATAGDPFRITIRGERGAPITLIGPDGTRDSLPDDTLVMATVHPRAPGRWIWTIVRGARRDTVGVDVRAAPRLAALLVEGRPGFELPALRRLLAAQGARVTLRTRLTGRDDRLQRSGADAPPATLDARTLAALDVVLLGPDAEATLSDGERALLGRAVEEGLGLFRMIDAPVAPGPLQPFTAVADGTEPREVHPVVGEPGAQDGAPTIAAAPLRLRGGRTLVADRTGHPLAAVADRGRGRVGTTILLTPSRWTLAGVPDAAAAWWSLVLGAVLRPPAGEWRMPDALETRVDRRVVLERVGEGAAGALVIAPDGRRDSVTLAPAAGDPARGRLAWWPRVPGWHSIVADDDTLRLLVAGPVPAAPPTTDAPGSGPAGPPRWLGWSLLVVAFLALWRHR